MAVLSERSHQRFDQRRARGRGEIAPAADSSPRSSRAAGSRPPTPEAFFLASSQGET